MKRRVIFRLVLALLTLAILLSVVSCTPNGPADPDPEPQEEQEAETKLTIAGKSIANHKILFPEGKNDLALKIRAAISSAYDFTLPTTTTDPENGKVIWLKEDPQQSPASCRVYVDGRALILAVHDQAFFGDVINLFKSTLEGEIMDYPSNFSISKNFEAVPYQSVKGEKKLTGDADKNPLSYAVGEDATFTVAAISGDKLLSIPYFHVETWSEATGKKTDEYLEGSKGYFEYSVQNFDREGYFYFKVNAADESKNKISGFTDTAEEKDYFVGGIAFGFDNIKPAAQTPDSFDSYWDVVVNEVKAQSTSGMKLTKLSTTQTGYLTYYWQTPTGGKNANKEDNIAAGYLTIPTGASAENKIGLKICFRGYDGTIPIESPSYQKNTAVLVVSSHSFDQEKAKSDPIYYEKQKMRITNNYVKVDYFREMIKRDLFGARFLIEYFGEAGNNYWDGENFEVSGGSMGAMQSTAVAALTKKVTGVDVSLLNISIPWMCDVKSAAIGRRPRSWPSNIVDFEYFDEANFAHLVTCKVKIYAALGDRTCPASSVTAFYNQLQCEKTITFEQNTSHAGGVGGGKYQLSGGSAQ